MKKHFQVSLPQSLIDDLRLRLDHVRWPDTVEIMDWNYGTNLAYLQELMSYWQKDFDWRKQEQKLNQFNHFQASVAGQNIHFIHEQGNGPKPIPIVLTHGWPSTFYEMSKIIPLLTDPGAHGGDAADAFDVIVPSLPGYGFSDRPKEPGMTLRTISNLWTELMVDVLGYERFAAHGGDIGAGVTTHLGRYHPDRMIGIHVMAVAAPYLGPGTAPLTSAEQTYLNQVERWEQVEGAYDHQQSTKPQTLAYGLNDSPVGLAGWIIEKMRAWSDCSGNIERRFSKDELLTNLMIYWGTETINSSMRLYYDHKHFSKMDPAVHSIGVPAGVTLSVEPVNKAPKEWAERTYTNIQRWTELPRGGHFAAFEEPELLAEEIRAFFRPLREKM
ncbi:epoxide hydrolase family protein [Paenibacillus sp. XY044]|uniref:epoxide hydrolase family protein n=1 Tax=Paenibacillus sp. XY044 TaxID=2026089 RepID=UPI000B980139|nr:epoxide hydrolase family protein [Paenibacillus sp. XY044]OZB90124.1 multidrug MFS transporter [Paenibacillus sp. XY044]